MYSAPSPPRNQLICLMLYGSVMIIPTSPSFLISSCALLMMPFSFSVPGHFLCAEEHSASILHRFAYLRKVCDHRFFKYTRRSPFNSRSSFRMTSSLQYGTMLFARPPVAITVAFSPSSSSIRRITPSISAALL